LVVDVLIAIGLLIFGVLTGLHNQDDAPLRDPSAFSMLLNLVGTLPLILRRRYPVPVFAVIWSVTILHSFMGYPEGGPVIATLFALYAVAAHGPSRRAGVICLVCALVGTTSLIWTPDDPAGIGDILTIYTLLNASFVFGDNMRIRRAYINAVEDRAERLERERDVESQRAVLEERARIARELHDVVAHSMSVMVVQAGAARRTLDRDPDKAAEAVGHIESTGRAALEEMRRLVSVLRASTNGNGDTEAPRLPQPQPGDLGKLIHGCRDAGLYVTLNIQGDQRPLPPGLGLVVYRIVQEALTNTIRHAATSDAAVCLDYRPDAIAVTVTDDGRGAAAPKGSEPGHGLAGMRERVVLYGGELSAGPNPGGGFQVVAELPLEGAAV
jgi:signal transduction histidine kinase